MDSHESPHPELVEEFVAGCPRFFATCRFPGGVPDCSGRSCVESSTEGLSIGSNGPCVIVSSSLKCS